jgi:transglutaminase-like putative cysteine protease
MKIKDKKVKSKYFYTVIVWGLWLTLLVTSCAPAVNNPPVIPTATQGVTQAVPTAASTPTLVKPTVTATLPEPTPTLAPTVITAPKKALDYTNPQKYSVKYQVTIKNNGFTLTDLRLYLPMPGEWEAQQDLKIGAISPAPKSQDAEKTSGNAMVFWRVSGIPKSNSQQDFILNFDLTAYETITHIDPKIVQAYKTDSPDYKRYTTAEKYIESNDPEIVQLAAKLAGDEKNPYLLAKKFYDYIIEHAKYKLLGQGLNGAKYLLSKGNGECGDYSALFIALSRAKGIPSRPVVGYWAISGKDQTHVWAEFYLEGIGWIPVDATIGQQSSTKRAYYFGNMDNQRVILSKGYNSPLVPTGPDGYVAPILQVPLWWFWGSGDGNKMGLDITWSVSKK